jgi:hypothetical protein
MKSNSETGTGYLITAKYDGLFEKLTILEQVEK